MVLSKRERYIGIITGSALLILGLDHFVFTPLIAQKDALDAKIVDARDEQDRASKLFKRRREASAIWNTMVNGGLQRDASAAEVQVQHSLNDWAAESRMSLSQLKTERTEKEKDFYRITMRAVGTGGMSEISRFLWRIQTATVPVRVTDLQITSRKDGTDELTVSIGVSTISLVPDAEKTKTASAGAAMREMMN
ncbi:MAG TPA: GspMb/PilO family protein [Tepidisphaeraceae bacterium]